MTTLEVLFLVLVPSLSHSRALQSLSQRVHKKLQRVEAHELLAVGVEARVVGRVRRLQGAWPLSWSTCTGGWAMAWGNNPRGLSF